MRFSDSIVRITAITLFLSLCTASTAHSQGTRTTIAGFKKLDEEIKTLNTEKKRLEAEGLNIRAKQEQVEKLQQSAPKTRGPFKIWSQKDVVFAGKYHFINDRLKTFSTYEEAVAWLKSLGQNGYYATSSQDTFLFEDASGADMYKNPPESDLGLESLEISLKEEIKEYQQQLSLFKDKISRFQGQLREIEENVVGMSPEDLQTAARLMVTPDMTANSPVLDEADQSIGKTIGDGSSESFVEKTAQLPSSDQWIAGDRAKGNKKLVPGTPLATFGEDGKYTKGRGSHTALFVREDRGGLWVFDQYKSSSGNQKPVDVRYLKYGGKPGASSANDGANYSVIETQK